MNTYFDEKNINKRFFFITGKTSDTFCDEALNDVDFEFLLNSELERCGYRRIIFYSRTQKLYCFNRESYELTLNPNQPKKVMHKVSLGLKGPLGGKLLSGKKPEEEKKEESGALHFDKMSELDAFNKIDVCMCDKDIKTAIVFSNAEDFITFFGEVRTERGSENIRSKVYDSFNEYDNLGYQNSNIMIFVFPQKPLNSISDEYSRNTIWNTFFKPKLEEKNANVINIGISSEAEVRNAINLIRIKHRLEVDYSSLDEMCRMLYRYLCKNQETLVGLMQRLRFLAEDNRKLDMAMCEELCEMKNKKSALERLEELTGMESVKEQIRTFVKKAEMNKTVKDNGYIARIEPQPICNNFHETLHLALTGNPGTGKTTVANLIGEIYYELGYLKSGHTKKVTRDDLVAGYVGQTAMKTKDAIQDAMGGVLFIDEAYTLKRSDNNDNDFGQEAIDTLVEAMTAQNGQFACIIAGYPKEIAKFIDSNPGLESRFKRIINIDDYAPSELMEIFERYSAKQNCVTDEELGELMPSFFENWYRQRDEKWGNARNVESLLKDMYDHWCMRGGERDSLGRYILTKEDIPGELSVHLVPLSVSKKAAIDELESLIGLDGVKNQIAALRRRIAIGGSSEPGHYRFEGNPGTGKTTVARLLGSIFCEVGVLRTDNVVEVSRADLVAEYEGQTASKTLKVLESALDGVLFVDEAYTLCDSNDRGGFGKEALNTILSFMENNRDRICVIFAGYHDDIQRLIDSNDGFASRFSDPIVFEDYNSAELLEILKLYCKKEGFICEEKFLQKSAQIFELWLENKSDSFGNARDVRKYMEKCIDTLYERLEKQYGLSNIPNEAKTLFTGADVPIEYNFLFVK